MSRAPVPDVSSLIALARGQGLDMRPVILRVQTDLFVSAPVRDRGSIEAFAALATGLLPTVDDETAATIARKLVLQEDTPESVLALLASRGGEARRVIVASAPELTPSIVEAAGADGADLSPLVAERPTLDQGGLQRLVERNDSATDLVLASNASVTLPPAAVELLVGRARRLPSLAKALLARHELSAAELAPLYLHAESAQRVQIRTGLAGVASLRGSASRLSRPEPWACERLVDLAGAGDAAAFGVELAHFLGLPSAPEWRFEASGREELLALALLAMGVSDEDAIRIFLTLHPAIARSVETVFGLAQLVRSTPRTTAIHLVQSVLGVTTSLRPAAVQLPQGPTQEVATQPPQRHAASVRRAQAERSRRVS